MKGEAKPGLKLGTLKKLVRSRAECKRERIKHFKLCAFPMPALQQWREIITNVLSPNTKEFDVFYKGGKRRLCLKRCCAPGFCFHPFCSGCVVSWGFHHSFSWLPVGCWLPSLDLNIRPSFWAPNLDIQYLWFGSFIHMTHKKVR